MHTTGSRECKDLRSEACAVAGQATNSGISSPRLTTEVLASILTAAASNATAAPLAPPPVSRSCLCSPTALMA